MHNKANMGILTEHKDAPSDNSLGAFASGMNFTSTCEGGMQLKAYNDGYGNYTIGIGSLKMPNGSAVQASDTITSAQGWAMFAPFYKGCWEAVDQFLPKPSWMTDDQFLQCKIGLADLAYNCGNGALQGDVKTAWDKMTAWPDIEAVMQAVMEWDKAGTPPTVSQGLKNRRKAECMIMDGMAPALSYQIAFK